MSYTDNKRIDGKDVALVLMGLAGVGGYLYLDHKLTLEQQTNAKLATLAQQTALALKAAQTVAQGAAAMQGAAEQAQRALPPAPPTRNAGRVGRLELAPRTFDDTFARRGRGLPVAYLRALALHASDMDPRLADGPGWGLLQVLDVVRTDFNRREGANVVREDLLDPSINVSIAASALTLIARSYAAHHASTRNLRVDWRSPQFVALLTFGWDAGWTEKAGVGRVASYLEQRGETVDINAVADAAKAAGASPHLSNPGKLAWAKQVTRQYFAELADDERTAELNGGATRTSGAQRVIVVDDPDDADAYADQDEGERVVVVHDPSASSDHEDAGPVVAPVQVEHDGAPVQVEHDGGAQGPITSPEQLDAAQAPGAMPMHPDHIVAGPGAPAIQVQPSGGTGPIDPYGPPAGESGPVDPYAGDEPAHHGYPEDPYAYLPPPPPPGARYA